MLVRSFGRLSTQTLSSLSTASPVTPPIFHLFGSGLGQSGSNLYFGTDDDDDCACACAAIAAHRATPQKPTGMASIASIASGCTVLFMALLRDASSALSLHGLGEDERITVRILDHEFHLAVGLTMKPL